MDVNQTTISTTSIQNDVIENKLVEESNVTKSRFSPFYRQMYATLASLCCTISVGMVLGYSAILIPELQHPHSRIEINDSYASWIASSPILPMAFGSLFCAFFMDHFGRKTTHLIVNVPFVISWCIISTSTQLSILLVGRSLTGFCAGLFSPVGPTYLAEISGPEHRGLFLSSVTFAIAVGVLITHSLALYVKWSVNALVCALFPLLSYCLITFAPESPSWLLRKNRIQDAFNAFKWFRGADETAIKEFETMIDAQLKVPTTHNDDDNGNSNVHNETKKSKNQFKCFWLKLRELAINKSFTRPWIILSVYFATLQMSGMTVITFYTVTILKKSLGNNINEYTATLTIDVIRLLASLIACIVMKSVGRRILTIFSGISTALSLFSLSFYLYLANEYVYFEQIAIVPLILFSIYMLVISIGISPLPWCLTSELFPLRYRAIGTAFVTFFNFLCFFGIVKSSPSFFIIYGPSYTFFIYGIFTMAGTIFLMIFLPETKNKSLQAIEDSYTRPSKSNIKIKCNKVQP